MDKSIKDFLFLSGLLMLFSVLILAIFGYIYLYSDINTYSNILLFLIAVTIIVILVFIIAMAAVLHAYRKRHVSSAFSWPVKLGLRVLLPFVTFISGILKGEKDAIRRFYVDINNILAGSYNKKYSPEKVLVVVPHCLQDSACDCKVTNDIGNCKRCGKCTIGDIARIAEEMKVEARVATGGTAARNFVNMSRPEVILSVACERDLVVGISDVGNIPVFGIVNERPNGPCRYTTVDVGVLRKRLEEIVKS